MQKGEIYKITIDDVVENDGVVTVKVPDTETNREKSFDLIKCMVPFYVKYRALRPLNLETNKFFLSYKGGKCTGHIAGRRKIAKVPKEIASYLGLENSELYTGNCFRQAAAALLVASGAEWRSVKRLKGWRSVAAHGYLEENSSSSNNAE